MYHAKNLLVNIYATYAKKKLTTHYSLLTTDMPRTKNMLVHGLATHKELPGKQYAIIHRGLMR